VAQIDKSKYALCRYVSNTILVTQTVFTLQIVKQK